MKTRETMGSNPGPNHRYSDRPFIAIWEATRACDLACVHCRASAESKPYPGELNTVQALDLIRQIAEWKVPLFVMTGGDPLKREGPSPSHRRMRETRYDLRPRALRNAPSHL